MGIVMSVQKCDLGCVVMSLSGCVMWVLLCQYRSVTWAV